MRLFTCTCSWLFVVGKQQVFGPMFAGPGEHSHYWHIGQLMTRKAFEDQYADCAYRLERGMGRIEKVAA